MRFRKQIIVIMSLVLFIGFSLSFNAMAADHYIDPAIYYYENPDTGYIAAIQDMAWIFSEDQKKEIIEEIAPVTEYGNAFLFTTDEPVLATDDFALKAYTGVFGNDSGVMIVEDVNGRTIQMRTFGEIGKAVTSSEINIIVNDVLKYAEDGDYKQCVVKAFSEVGTVMEGGKIGEILSGSGIGRPLKFIGCFFIAFILSFFINFMIVRMHTRKKDVAAEETIMGLYSRCRAEDYRDEVIATQSVYAPLSSKKSRDSDGPFGRKSFW
ncbi:MAG: TPM domain-containing protein [Lachnospiraceae bacterium]|nr:TPM domain-containing protein [Lachnospiraceae bacterium]